MLEQKVNCISTQNLKHGLKLKKFQYEQDYDSFEFASEMFQFTTAVSDELKLGWIVTESGCKNRQWMWEEIRLEKCSRNISFNIMIQADKNQHILKGDINASSLPLKHKLLSCIFTRVTVTFDIYYEDDTVSPLIEPLVLLETYDKLLENKDSSDIVFVFEEEGEKKEITAHTLILSARSEVFAVMFDSDMVEKNTGRVEIVDFEPIIFKQLLRFIYSGKIASWDTDELLKLLGAADKYAVNDLVTICVDKLSGKLSVDNAVEILIIADQVNADQLKKECTNVIVKNKKKIVGSPSFKELRKFHKDLALQILDFFMEEEENLLE